ncbi:MAG: T9SS type A sorting domain-containing protein [Bacteroidales bacterium]|nr:T9SS type A sorting domain-containing protein [Bacteroidales bacterium]
MKNRRLLIILTFFYLIINSNLKSQPNITNYYNYNDVFAIAIDTISGSSTENTIWLGTKSGVVNLSLSSGETQVKYNKENVNGLSSNFIISIAIDNLGNKWFGSFDNGVTFYNGTDWIIYNSENSNMNNHVNAITVEGDNSVWFASPDGVRRYSSSNNFVHYSDDGNGHTISDVVDIYADGYMVYCATPNSLFVFNGSNNSWQMYTQTQMNISGYNLTSVAARQGIIYVGTAGGGVSRYDGAWSNYNGFTNNFVTDITFNNDGKPSAATQLGVYYYETGTWEPWSAMWILNDIRVFACDDTGAGWAGFEQLGNGVQKATDYSVTGIPMPYVEPENLPKSDINDILVNGSGNVLIATEGGGLSIFDGNTTWNNQKITGMPPEIPSNIVRDIDIVSGEIWCATDYGVGFYDYTTWITYNHLNSSIIDDNVRSVAIDKNGYKWFGTNVGVSFYDGTSWTNYTTTDGLLNNEVVSIAVDINNHIWFLHPYGVTEFDGTIWKTYSLINIGFTSGAYLSKIDAEKSAGGKGVWIGSSEGVAYYNETNWIIYKTSNSGLAGNEVTSVYVDYSDVKHFGTKNGVISIFNGTNWTKVTTDQGLASSYISAVYFDASRNAIWSGGQWGGLSKIETDPITLTITYDKTNICKGEEVSLSADPSGGFGNFTYIWTSEPVGFSSNDKDIGVSPDQITKYIVTVSDGIESQTADIEIFVNVVELSEIRGASTICENSQNINYYVNYDSEKEYYWWIDGGNITQENNLETIYVDWYGANENASVNLTETLIDIGCSVTSRFPVNIVPNVIPEILRKGDNLLICVDSGQAHYQWIKNEMNIEGANKQFYNIPTNSDRNGTYSLQVTTEFNCIGYSDFIEIGTNDIKIFPNPTSDIINLEINNDAIGQGIIYIRDSGGKIIQTNYFEKNENKKTINLFITHNLNGIYYVDVYINNKFCFSKKMIVN